MTDKLVGALELALTVILEHSDSLHDEEYIVEICTVLRAAGSKHAAVAGVLDFGLVRPDPRPDPDPFPDKLGARLGKLLDDLNPYSGNGKKIDEVLRSYPCA